MMNLFAEYYKERQDLETIATASGFIVYGIHEEHALLNDIYITPKSRGSFSRDSQAVILYDLFVAKAKEAGCKRIFANFSIADKSASKNLTTCLRRGFKLISAVNQTITVCKEIE